MSLKSLCRLYPTSVLFSFLLLLVVVEHKNVEILNHMFLYLDLASTGV